MALDIGYVIVEGASGGVQRPEDEWQLCQTGVRKRFALHRQRDGYIRPHARSWAPPPLVDFHCFLFAFLVVNPPYPHS